jgi:tetratricopeptide (TPR) repeat protein
MRDFKLNMGEILKKARKKNVPVLFGDLVSNIHDLKPFQSIKSSKYPEAEKIYARAQEYEKQGLYDSARVYYYMAKDLDGIRFRAPEDINQIIYELCKENNADVVHVKDCFEQNSPNKFIGNNLMVEHLHPNVTGYFLLADVFFNAMHDRKLSSNWDTSLIKPSSYYRSIWGFTVLDSLIADIKVRSLLSGWPFKPEKVKNNFIYEYKPKNYADTLAIRCVVYKNVAVADMHQELAKYYVQQGNYSGAYEEYNSLVRSHPYITDFYLNAERYADLNNDYRKALNLILNYPNLKNSFILNLQAGKLFQKLKEPEKAIAYYKKAQYAEKPEDNKELLLVSLYSAYIEVDKKKEAEEILLRIKEINPNFDPYSDTKKREVVVTVDKESKDLIDKALILVKKNELDKALELLFEAQKIRETSYCNQIIGSILFEQRNPEAITYLLKAYNDTPNEPGLLTNIVVIYVMNKDYKSASKYLKELKVVSTPSEKTKKLEEIINKNLGITRE